MPGGCGQRRRAGRARPRMSRSRCASVFNAQHLRPLLTSALPHLAVQARLELVRVTWRLPIRQVPGRSCARSMTCLGAGPASGPLSGRPGHSGSALQGLRFEHPGASALTDRCRAAPPPAARQSPGPVSSVSWRDDYPVFHPIRAMELAPARSGLVPCSGGVTRARDTRNWIDRAIDRAIE